MCVDFLSGKLGGMNESSSTLDVSAEDLTQLQSIVTRTANVGQVPSTEENVVMYAGQTLSNKCDVLVKIRATDCKTEITVNCEKIVIGSMLIKDIKMAMASS